jgi:hypothetical protein
MLSEEASSQPQNTVKFRSFRSSNRLMNSDATVGLILFLSNAKRDGGYTNERSASDHLFRHLSL